MPRWLKRTLIGVAAALALAVIGLIALVNLIDLNHYARVAVEQVRVATGRDLRIGARLDVRIFPRLAIVAEDVAFGNAPWGSRRDMVRIKRVEGAVALLPLLRRQIEIVRLVAVEPDVLLETNANGVGNWVFRPAPAAPPPEGPSAAPYFGISGVAIDGGALVYRDGVTKKTLRLTVQRLRLTKKLLTAKDDVAVEAVFRDQPFTLSGTMGTIQGLLAQENGWPVQLALAVGGAQATIAGDIDWGAPIPGLNGTIDAEVKDTAGLARLVGSALALPTPLGLSARLVAYSGEQRIDALRVTVAKSAAHGRMVVRTTLPRHVSVQLRSDEIDLTPLAKTEREAREDRVFSETPFPLGALRALSGDADIAVARLILPNRVPLERVAVRAVLKDGRLDVQPVHATLGGGGISGRGVLDASKPNASTLRVQLEGTGINLEKVAGAMGAGGTVTGGMADVALSLSGPGESLHRFLGWSNGEVRVVIGPARLSGTALDAGGDALTRVFDAANPLRRKEGHTDLKCAVARLPVSDGVAIARRSIAYETGKINVVIAGTINLRTEALDLAVRPSVKEGLGIGVANLAELVRVTGTLTRPSIGIDTLESAKAALSIGGAIFTSGLSLVGQMLLSARANDPQPCQSALGTPAPAAAAPKQEEGGFFGPLRRLLK